MNTIEQMDELVDQLIEMENDYYKQGMTIDALKIENVRLRLCMIMDSYVNE